MCPLFKFGGHIYYGKGDQPLTFVISILEQAALTTLIRHIVQICRTRNVSPQCLKKNARNTLIEFSDRYQQNCSINWIKTLGQNVIQTLGQRDSK